MYTSRIRSIHPIGCGCTTCSSSDGSSTPLEQATPEQVLSMLIDGLPQDRTRESWDIAVHWELEPEQGMSEVRPRRVTATSGSGQSRTLPDIGAHGWGWAVRYR
ncbi:hypothetical protein ACIBG7_27075 [Nonomuraea sp. NPDC050328]|uniref:hypothetical protein n=1 Tax=Nonomuraea sp. NPDC050328 TaxID=3364361 RepID=UPI0037B26CC6